MSILLDAFNEMALLEPEVALHLEKKYGRDWEKQLSAEANRAKEFVGIKVWSVDDTVKEMKAEAKRRGLRGYSRLKEAELIELLNGTPND